MRDLERQITTRYVERGLDPQPVGSTSSLPTIRPPATTDSYFVTLPTIPLVEIAGLAAGFDNQWMLAFNEIGRGPATALSAETGERVLHSEQLDFS